MTSSCPALNTSTSLLSNLPSLPDPSAQESGYFAEISVIGELFLRPGGIDRELLEGRKVVEWLEGVTDLIGDTDSVLTSFPTPLRRSDNAHEVLR